MEHARTFSASALDRLIACPGSAVLTADAPRTASTYSAWGTACHELASIALLKGDQVYVDRKGTRISADGFDFEVDDEMVEVAKRYTDYVRDVAGADGTILVEQRVDFSSDLGVDEAFGTADALIVRGDEMIVVDLKTGRGVEVEADTAQLKAYALGCLPIADQVADIERVRLVIVQPRNGGIKEHDMGVDELRAWAHTRAAPAARKVLEAMAEFSVGHLNPGEKQCKFCAAKATCPALRDEVAETVALVAPASPEEFANRVEEVTESLVPNSKPEWLAACLAKVDLIEDWCKAVREQAHKRLSEGQELPGWKLVAGKRGARAWTDAKAAEELLRNRFRLNVEQAYDLKLISPTSAEKLAKAGTLGPKQWAVAQELIHQPDGKPHVAPESDPRPALAVAAKASEFETLA